MRPELSYTICENCGRPTAIRGVLTMVSTTARVWESAQITAKRSEQGTFGSSEVARLAKCHPATALRHLERLYRFYRVVEPVPKRNGGVYVAWRLAEKKPAR